EQLGGVAPVYTAGIGYGYNFIELGQNPQLTADKPRAARRAYEEFVDEVALKGDDAKKLSGLFNLGSGDRQRGNDNSNWESAEVGEVLELLFDALALAGDDGSITADTLLLPASLY